MKKSILSIIVLLYCMTPAVAQIYPPGVYEVDNLERFQEVITHRGSGGKSYAEIKLTADLYLSDLSERIFVNTFCGTIDGNGHTIWAARPEIQHDGGGHYKRYYLFPYSDGATFKNLQFKNIRVQSEEHDNMCIITSQATNCTFENITFDNVSIFCNNDNVGAAAGIAKSCTFTNIIVKNGDFTLDNDNVGAVVGYADGCTFTKIEVDNCECTTPHNDNAGGVVGKAENGCAFTNVDITNSLIKSEGVSSGGVAGDSSGSLFKNCKTDDMTCVFADGSTAWAHVGGIVGNSLGDNLLDCYNSAFITASQDYVGGIAGHAKNTKIYGCLNTGIVMGLSDSYLADYYNRYRQASLDTHEYDYKGVRYLIRTLNDDQISDTRAIRGIGGIVGKCEDSDIIKCANIGSLYYYYNPNPIIGGGQAGGIVGEPYHGSSRVTDCFCDFKGCETYHLYGIVGKDGTAITIENCLSLLPQHKMYKDPETSSTTYPGSTISPGGGYGINPKNNYMLFTKGQVEGATVVTAEELASGKILSRLGTNWEQNLGTDKCPTPGNRGLYHTRKVSNEYGTVCLPFAVKSDDKISYYKFLNEYAENDGVTLRFQYAEDEVEAGYPVLFRVADFTETVKPVEICFNDAGGRFNDEPYGRIFPKWDLVGTFIEKVFAESTNPNSKEIYYVSGGEICNAKKTTIRPYRAYICGPSIDTFTNNGTQQAKSIRFVLDDKDGVTTAFETVGDNLVPVQKSGKTYSIMGTEVNGNYRGIVIKNGKKMIQNR